MEYNRILIKLCYYSNRDRIGDIFKWNKLRIEGLILYGFICGFWGSGFFEVEYSSFGSYNW